MNDSSNDMDKREKNLRIEIATKIERDVSRPLLHIIEQYHRSQMIDENKVKFVLTCILGLSKCIRLNITDRSECIQMMAACESKVNLLYQVYTKRE